MRGHYVNDVRVNIQPSNSPTSGQDHRVYEDWSATFGEIAYTDKFEYKIDSLVAKEDRVYCEVQAFDPDFGYHPNRFAGVSISLHTPTGLSSVMFSVNESREIALRILEACNEADKINHPDW